MISLEQFAGKQREYAWVQEGAGQCSACTAYSRALACKGRTGKRRKRLHTSSSGCHKHCRAADSYPCLSITGCWCIHNTRTAFACEAHLVGAILADAWQSSLYLRSFPDRWFHPIQFRLAPIRTQIPQKRHRPLVLLVASDLAMVLADHLSLS